MSVSSNIDGGFNLFGNTLKTILAYHCASDRNFFLEHQNVCINPDGLQQPREHDWYPYPPVLKELPKYAIPVNSFNSIPIPNDYGPKFPIFDKPFMKTDVRRFHPHYKKPFSMQRFLSILRIIRKIPHNSSDKKHLGGPFHKGKNHFVKNPKKIQPKHPIMPPRPKKQHPFKRHPKKLHPMIPHHNPMHPNKRNSKNPQPHKKKPMISHPRHNMRHPKKQHPMIPHHNPIHPIKRNSKNPQTHKSKHTTHHNMQHPKNKHPMIRHHSPNKHSHVKNPKISHPLHNIRNPKKPKSKKKHPHKSKPVKPLPRHPKKRNSEKQQPHKSKPMIPHRSKPASPSKNKTPKHIRPHQIKNHPTPSHPAISHPNIPHKSTPHMPKKIDHQKPSIKPKMNSKKKPPLISAKTAAKKNSPNTETKMAKTMAKPKKPSSSGTSSS